jgi:magnesium transporter
MINAYILFGDGRISRGTEPRELSAAMRDPKARFWVDMEKPTDEELSLLDEVFGFHPLAIEDSIQYSQRPKIESYFHTGDTCREGYFYMVFHGPDLESFREKLRTKELDVFVSERYMVTIHDEKMKSIMEVRQRADSDAHLVLDPGIDMLLHNILDHLVDHYRPILDYLEETLDELEEQALRNPTPELLSHIASKKRELLNMRRTVGPQREVIAQLTRGEVPFIREGTRVYLRDVLDHIVRTVEMLELYRDLVLGARDIYLSSVSNRLNQIMKTLTIISVIAMPMTVITGFFGMNFDALPGLHNVWAFWVAVISMLAIVGTMLVWFRSKGWV